MLAVMLGQIGLLALQIRDILLVRLMLQLILKHMMKLIGLLIPSRYINEYLIERKVGRIRKS